MTASKTSLPAVRLLCLALLAGCASVPKAEYVAPLDGPIAQGYGEGRAKFHHGVDVTAAGGSLVRATTGGTVIYRGSTKSFGRMVVVDHGAGVRTYYGSLSRFSVRKGQTVQTGDAIGRVGRKGQQKPAHLHFELRLKEESLDPTNIVPFRKDTAGQGQ